MTITPEKGKYQCVVCKKIWDSSELIQDPSKTGRNWVCGDYFCGANVIKLNENKHSSIGHSQMQTLDQVALGKIMRREWPDLVKEIESFESYFLDKSFLTEPIIVKIKGEVVGGNYMTTHKDELKKFVKETPSLEGKNLIVAEYFVMNPEVRNQGIGRQLLEFIQREYLSRFDGIILKSNIIETQAFYARLGGEILFDGVPHGIEYHPVWKKNILSKGTTFLYTLEK